MTKKRKADYLRSQDRIVRIDRDNQPHVKRSPGRPNKRQYDTFCLKHAKTIKYKEEEEGMVICLDKLLQQLAKTKTLKKGFTDFSHYFN